MSSSSSSAVAPRPPLVPWSASTWKSRWAAQARLSATPVPRTPLLLLKAPASTLYEEKFGGDRNVFTTAMYCGRMTAKKILVGCAVDCTALDIEEFEPLPSLTTTGKGPKKKAYWDRRVRYFHNPSEWDDYDVEYHRLVPPSASSEQDEESSSSSSSQPVAPQVITQFLEIVSDFLKSSSAYNGGNESAAHIALFDSRGGCGAAAYLAGCYMCAKLRAPVHVALLALEVGTPPHPGGRPDEKMNGRANGKGWGLCDVRLAKDLQIRYKGKRELTLHGAVPSWWWAMEDEDDDDDEDDENNDGEGGGDTNGEDPAATSNGDAGDDEGRTIKIKKKRARDTEETIVIPPYDQLPALQEQSDKDVKRRRTDSVDNGASATATPLFPAPPKEALEPLSRDSSRWKRAAAVLAQITSPTPSTLASVDRLPIRPERDVSDDAELSSSSVSVPTDPKVSWLSTKGRRGLLLVLSEAVFFIEEERREGTGLSVSHVSNMKFPNPKDLSRPQHRTLLDVILVLDKEKQRGGNGISEQHRFYALDVLCHEGGVVARKPLDQRLRFLNDGVLVPRKRDEASSAKNRQKYAGEPIKIRALEYFPSSKLKFVINDVCAGVGHEAKGARIVPGGAYALGEQGVEGGGEKALVWKKGGSVTEDHLLSLFSE